MGIFDKFKKKKQTQDSYVRPTRGYIFYSRTLNEDYKHTASCNDLGRSPSSEIYNLSDHNEVFCAFNTLFNHCDNERRNINHSQELFATCKTNNFVIYYYDCYDGRVDLGCRPIVSAFAVAVTKEESKKYPFSDFIQEIYAKKLEISENGRSAYDLADKFPIKWCTSIRHESFNPEKYKAEFLHPYLEQNKAWLSSTISNAVFLDERDYSKQKENSKSK